MVNEYMQMADPALTAILIVIGVALIALALAVKNPYIKAVVLAWVTLP